LELEEFNEEEKAVDLAETVANDVMRH